MSQQIRCWQLLYDSHSQDTQSRKVADSLLNLIEVEDGTGLGLFTAVKKLLNIFGIPLSNVIGFAANNCATMIGTVSGFQSQLKKEIPHIFVIGCVCHSFALVQMLPATTSHLGLKFSQRMSASIFHSVNTRCCAGSET